MYTLTTPASSLYARFRFARVAFWLDALGLLITSIVLISMVGCNVPSGHIGGVLHWHLDQEHETDDMFLPPVPTLMPSWEPPRPPSGV